jgi:glycosyltransferase involved in cell wall biosynthesis
MGYSLEKIFFSVIIPLFNKEFYIQRAILSVLAQSYHNFELLIVDDGSTDNSQSQLDTFSHDPRLRLFYQENKGVSSARNTGAKASKGMYVCFLDADDAWDSDFLETISQMIRTHPTAKMYTVGHRKVDEHGCLTYPFIDLPKEFSGPVPDFIYKYSNGYGIVNSSSVCIDRNFLLNFIGGFPEGKTRGEDIFVWLQIALHAQVISTSKRCVTIFRNATNRSNTKRFIIPYHFEYFYPKLSNICEQNNCHLAIFLRKNAPFQIFGALCAGQRFGALKFVFFLVKYDRYFYSYIPFLLTPKFILLLIRKMRNKFRKSSTCESS